MDARARPLSGCGIGLKPQHFDEVLRRRPALGFFEIHAENYMVDGGPFHRALGRIRADYPLTVHGVALSIGGTDPLDEAHLDRLAQLVERYEPAIVSEHLAWSSHGGVYFSDLLPLRYDAPTLARVSAHVDRMQQRLGRRVLLENPSTYVESRASTFSEGQFVGEVVRRTGCGLLLDVNNVYVSSVNHGRDAAACLAELPLSATGQIHLAGFTEDRDAAGDRLLIDSHGSAVDRDVWALYRRALEFTGPQPTLIEWDRDVPALDALLHEAGLADAALAEVARSAAGRRAGATRQCNA
jgi:uncharacterized protein